MEKVMYMFDPLTHEYQGSRPAQRVGDKTIMESAYATATPPPDAISTGYAARWTGTQWDLVEDHRQHLDSTGTKQGGTPYWLPSEGDDWQSPPRYTEDLGPLPAGAMTTRPEKPLSVVREEKEHEIRSACDAAIIASLTMPAVRPSATEVSVAGPPLRPWILMDRTRCWPCMRPAVMNFWPLSGLLTVSLPSRRSRSPMRSDPDDRSRGQGVPFERVRRITGYLVGTLKRFNNAKRAEERDRVKHATGGALDDKQ